MAGKKSILTRQPISSPRVPENERTRVLLKGSEFFCNFKTTAYNEIGEKKQLISQTFSFLTNV